MERAEDCLGDVGVGIWRDKAMRGEQMSLACVVSMFDLPPFSFRARCSGGNQPINGSRMTQAGSLWSLDISNLWPKVA
jgi:hypothetical protein